MDMQSWLRGGPYHTLPLRLLSRPTPARAANNDNNNNSPGSGRGPMPALAQPRAQQQEGHGLKRKRRSPEACPTDVVDQLHTDTTAAPNRAMISEEAQTYLEAIDSHISTLMDARSRLGHGGMPPSPEPIPSTSSRARSATSIDDSGDADSGDAGPSVSRPQSSVAPRVQGLVTPPNEPFIVRREMHPMHPAIPPTLSAVMSKITNSDWKHDPHYPALSLDRMVALCQRARGCPDPTSSAESRNTTVHNAILETALGTHAFDVLPVQLRPPPGPGQASWPLPCTLITMNAGHGQAQVLAHGVRFLSQVHDRNGLLGAELQIGITQAGHWDKLASEALAHAQARARAQAQLRARPWSQPWVAGKAPARSPPKLPDFLPGIIAQGHEWRFVVWTTKRIGSTDAVVGIYQIVHCLRHVNSWCREVYWPWYRDNTREVGEDAFDSRAALEEYCRVLAAAAGEWPAAM
ncbi:hypothetical protein VP1G_04357 [Cytospora mali]|uniref:PD-(D/E)XK nuclease-like domain-containing protein n=1 Tax=Cytospora mali TaxID=578113 RepID=A0A194UZ96_CYTMA|nr:hypothetical protein VP1G_04357 [Valsa mali var. pyri (nom. inval.)]